jgi:hypothetical protein
MYSDYLSYRFFGKAIITWDINVLLQNSMLDSRLFYLGMGILENEPNYFRKVLLGEREDKSLSTIGKTIISADSKLLEDIKENARAYSFGKGLIENSLLELESIKYDNNLYYLAKAIILNDIAILQHINNNEVAEFFKKVEKSEFSGIKNVIWDRTFVLQCLICQDDILPDQNGYFNYYFASNENKSVNHTFIYFKETKRHMFYKFCSKECCTKWVG